MKNFERSLYIFRRDFRVRDNTALLHALEQSNEVLVCFIFTPEQVAYNPYKSDRCVQFMIKSLGELAEEISSLGGILYFFKGESHEIVYKLIHEVKIQAIYTNRDFTPYSLKRDKQIQNVASEFNVPFFSFDDLLLNPPEAVLKPDGTPYHIFTPFYKKALLLPVCAPKEAHKRNYFKEPISFSSQILENVYSQPLSKIPGRKEALKIISRLGSEGNSISAHLKFNLCSPREIAQQGAKYPSLIRSLIWRDFFSMIAYYYPHVFEGPFNKKYLTFPWCNNQERFHAWKEGLTGFPIVDAAMRELKATGFISNRMRMIVACFLVKDLKINWQWGEQYFAQQLIDYDPAINNGNWQWIASTGADAQPFFRVFNPWIQQKKYDPDCSYIYDWIPELQSFLPNQIHNWAVDHFSLLSSYPKPIVDHNIEAKFFRD